MRMAGLHAAFGPGSLRAREHILSRHDSTPQLLSLIVPPVRALCYFLTGLMLAVMSGAGHAGGNVPPTFTPAAPPIVKYYGYTDPYALFATPEAACIQFVTYDAPVVFNSGGWVYDRVVPLNDNLWSCFAGGPLVSTPIALVAVLVMRSCDGLNWRNYAMTCATNTCPANSTGTPTINPTSCICDDGYIPDTTKTSCVLAPTCPISDIPQITDPVVQSYEDNPNLSDTAHLDPQMRDVALPCLLRAAAAGSPSVGSAYRPPAYNQHLIDVWKKWRYELMEDENPACAARKAKIQEHFKQHKLLITQPPVPNSRHTRGLAVDVTINLPPANIKALAGSCGLIRPKPVKDPVHFQFP